MGNGLDSSETDEFEDTSRTSVRLSRRSSAPWQTTMYTAADGAPLMAWPVCSAITRYDAETREVSGYAYAGGGRPAASSSTLRTTTTATTN